MTDLKKIEKIAQGIIAGYYGYTQDCGTEWQKWTHAVLQANKIYTGEYIVDKTTHLDGYNYVQQILQS